MRWLVILGFAAFAFGSTDARAQVFKPRGGAKAPAKAAPAKKTTDKPAEKTADKTADKPAAAPSRKATRATGPTARKVTTKTPASSRAAKGKGRPDDLTPDPKKDVEDVVIVTDEDDD